MQTAALQQQHPEGLQPIQPHEKWEFRSRLASQGKTIAQWCNDHGHDTTSIYRALRGLNKGRYGMAFHSVTAIRSFLEEKVLVASTDSNSH